MKILLGLFFLLCFSVQAAIACQCQKPSPDCESYTRNEVVFIGEIDEIVTPSKKDSKDKEKAHTQEIHFKVNHSFKNLNTNKFKLITSFNTSCDFEKIEVGQRWIVFGRRNKQNNLYFSKCDGSKEIDKNKPVAELLREFEFELDKPTVFINIFNFSGGPASDVEVSIKDGESLVERKSDSGFFRIELSELKKYKVNIFVPYQADFINYQYKMIETLNTKGNSSAFRYDADFTQNKCNYTNFVVSR